MHLLIATTQVPFVHGGAEMHAHNLVEALRGAGHAAEIVAIPFKWYPPERMLDAILACRLLDLTESNGRKVDRVIGLKFPAYLIPHPNKVLWILHQHRQAYEQWEHTLSDMVHYGNGREVREAIRLADTRLIPEARAVFTNSENVSRRLKHHCGLDSTPLYHPPGNAEAFYCETAEPYFFFPSRINASKRQLLAVQALALAGGDAKLIFCGESEDAAYLEKIQREVEDCGLDNRVKFYGRVSEKEKRALYARCLAVIYPPVDEDYGYITLEAMLSGKPVITCTDSGGPLEFIRDGVSGYVTAPEPAALAEAMAKLQEDRPELFFQLQNTRGEEVRQRQFNILKTLHVRDVLSAFDGEDEIVRRLLVPLGETFRALQGIERAVDFDRIQFAGGVGQFFAMLEFPGIEGSAPRAVGPAGDTDARVGGFCHGMFGYTRVMPSSEDELKKALKAFKKRFETDATG